MNKINICGLTQSGKLNDLKELLEPLFPYYDALNWVFHYPKDDGADFLESVKKNGRIIYLDFNYRLDFSRNHYLYCGTIKSGEYCFFLDDLERLKPNFFLQWPGLKYFLESNGIDGVTLYGKRFLYKFNDFLEFRGNPHEGLVGANRIIELTTIDEFKNTSWFWENVRPKKRDKFHYIWAFVNYYVNYPNSNHCLLGLDKYSNREEIFKVREYQRRKFRDYCQSLDILPLTKDKFIDLCGNRFDEIKEFINNEKIINDAYQYFILKNENLVEPHDLTGIIKIS